MDFSGPQGELLPMAMHAGGGSPFLGLHHEHEHHHHHHRGPNGRHSMSPPEAVEEELNKDRHALAVVPVASAGGGGAVRYRECLKNHAAAIGRSATDGCGEFMPAGEEGSLDALRCSACGCHRNFHRREPPGGDGGRHHHQLYHHQHHHLGGGGGPLSPLHHHQRGMLVAALPPAPTRMVMPLSASAAAAVHHHHGALSAESDEAGRPQVGARKRFRTKFTAEQKARMLGFAEAAGWRLQKLEDAAVQRFCQEVGVKRRVLKVWMHNNKHTLARRHADDDPHQQPQPGDGPPLHSEHPGRRSPSPTQPQLRLE